MSKFTNNGTLVGLFGSFNASPESCLVVVPAVAAVVPTLSFPMLALLGVALAAGALLVIRRA
jgi:hypothetical protein